MSQRVDVPSELRGEPSTPRRRDRARTTAELNEAVLRLEREGLLSITAVAAAVGVTPSLIHNTYPDVVRVIREKLGLTDREKLKLKADQLAKVTGDLKTYKRELLAAHADIARLASTNETLNDEITSLRAQLSGKLAPIGKSKVS